MPWLEIVVVLLLIAVNGFLVMAELAIVSSRRSRLQILAEEGLRGAEPALKLAADPARFLSSAQIGITVVAILSGAYGERALSPALAELLRSATPIGAYAEAVASTIVVISIAYVSLVVGELAPKQLALANPERLACFVAPAMQLLAYAAAPIASLLRYSSDQVLRLVALPSRHDAQATEEEVKSLIAEGTEAGVFEKAEQEIIEGVLRVGDRSVRSIMVPRPDIVWLDLAEDDAKIYEAVVKSGHSRFPVSRGDVDKTIGIVQAKALLEQLHDIGKFNLQAALKTPLYVHESTKVLKLLEMFKASVVHVAIVLDEHGTVQGMVTPTDILTGFAGELAEEEDNEGPSAVQREDGSWLLDAQMPVHEVERVLGLRGLSADDDEYATLAGFVLSQLGHIPATGEYFEWEGWRFEVIDLDGRRIDKVMAARKRNGG